MQTNDTRTIVGELSVNNYKLQVDGVELKELLSGYIDKSVTITINAQDLRAR